MMRTVEIDTENRDERMAKGTVIAVWALISCLVVGCAVKHAGIEDQRAAMLFREALVRHIEFTEKGLPVPGTALRKRPSRAHRQFTVVQFMNDRLATSFDIAVDERDADFTRPFRAIYKWTGKGFEWGVKASSATANSLGGAPVHSMEELAAVLVIIVSPIAVCTAGGVVIGVADGIRQTAVELGKVVVNRRERVVTYTTYAYDARDRLSLMRMYKADDHKELVRTEFYYAGVSAAPARTTVTRFPEGTVQVLQ